MIVHLKNAVYAACLFVFLFFASCTPGGVRLSVQGIDAVDAAGTYTAVLYGCNFNDDPESIAFLDREGDPYVMEPYAPSFNFRTVKGLGAKDAFDLAEGFLHCSTSLQGYQIRQISAPGAGVIGYEVRPLSYPFVYGADDMLTVDYWMKDGRVTIFIRLKPWAEHFFFGGSSSIED